VAVVAASVQEAVVVARPWRVPAAAVDSAQAVLFLAAAAVAPSIAAVVAVADTPIAAAVTVAVAATIVAAAGLSRAQSPVP
jgi:hypothetical protein